MKEYNLPFASLIEQNPEADRVVCLGYRIKQFMVQFLPSSCQANDQVMVLQKEKSGRDDST
jgi:hypothetical protein